MPMYVYRCKQCGAMFEKMVRLSEADRSQPCPQCQSHETQKQITTFASSISGGSSAGGSSCGSSGGFS